MSIPWLNSKQSAERYFIIFDFTARLGTATIAAATVTVLDQVTDIDVTSVITDLTRQVIASTNVSVFIQGGTSGRQYVIVCQIIASDGKILKMDYLLPIIDLDIAGGGGIGPVTISGVTGNFSADPSYPFFTGSNKDLTPYLGLFGDWNDGTYHIRGQILTPGTGQTYGPELLTAWANDPTYPFETFTLSGTDITSAINSVTFGLCTADIVADSKGKLFKYDYNFTLNSGGTPQWFLYGGDPSLANYVSGANTIYRTPMFAGNICVPFLQLLSASNFSLVSNVFRQVLSPNVNGYNVGNLSADDNFNMTGPWTLTISDLPANGILTFGDSKTALHQWQPGLITALGTSCWESPTFIAYLGTTVSYMAAHIDAILAKASGTPAYILCDIGVVECESTLPAKATWEANYQYIIDAFHVKWPAARIYLAKPWGQGCDANCATLAGWIDDLVAASPMVVHAGHDEQIWLAAADNGATMTTDRFHYSAAGIAEVINQWKTILIS